MIRSRLTVVSLVAFAVAPASLPGSVWAESDLEPTDPIASVENQPVFLGELHLLLTGQLGLEQLDNVRPAAKRAAALILVRRHLAMRSLRQQGGEALQALIDRRIDAFAEALRVRGSSLQEHAERRRADEVSLRSDLAWRIAWEQYLKSRLTEENLKRFFESNRLRYAGGRWEVSQIFLDVDRSEPEAEGIATHRIERIAESLRSADDLEAAFAAAARAESDAASADQGGQVGWVESAGDLPRGVFDAVRSTSAGKLAGPVRSSFGWHLVLVHRAEAKPIAFESLSDRDRLRRDAADALFAALVLRQADAKIRWYVSQFEPPPGVEVIQTSPGRTQNRGEPDASPQQAP